jgi:deazaflavin-dependent oxidoreductase (nitroreductase family)
VVGVIDLSSRPAPTAFSERVSTLNMRGMEAINLFLFRLSDGRSGGTIFGQPVILLTTTGRTTGVRRTKPLLAMRDEARGGWIVVASKGGSNGHPEWYRNLVAYHADPGRLAAPTVEAAGGVSTPVRAEPLEGDERASWWNRLVGVYPKFAAYQRRTPREIPVLRLTPIH